MNREEADALIEQLYNMSFGELEKRWKALFGTHCYSHNRAYLCRRLEWRINTLVSGGISERAMKRAEEIADDTLLKTRCRKYRPRQPKRSQIQKLPTYIRKRYKGKDYEVRQTADGFFYNGQRYATLSEVSSLIAGYYVSGKRFFGIKRESES